MSCGLRSAAEWRCSASRSFACSTAFEVNIMLGLTLGAITAAGLLIYLLAVLIAPEKF